MTRPRRGKGGRSNNNGCPETPNANKIILFEGVDFHFFSPLGANTRKQQHGAIAQHHTISHLFADIEAAFEDRSLLLLFTVFCTHTHYYQVSFRSCRSVF
jgi:hypothetical protein